MSDTEDIRVDVMKRGITRLCHFTQSRKFIDMIAETHAILPTSEIQKNHRDMLDALRLDGRLDHVCCSIEYPNVWYFEKIKNNDPLFRDWVILCLNPCLLWERQCLFSPLNAATQRGAFITKGWDGWRSLFAPYIQGAGGYVRSRQNILSCSPTDDQAEVLVPGPIPKNFIQAVIVRDEEQARSERARFRALKLDITFDWIVSPTLFGKSMSSQIRGGRRPDEYILSED
jgi:hypothetical protein